MSEFKIGDRVKIKLPDKSNKFWIGKWNYHGVDQPERFEGWVGVVQEINPGTPSCRLDFESGLKTGVFWPCDALALVTAGSASEDPKQFKFSVGDIVRVKIPKGSPRLDAKSGLYCGIRGAREFDGVAGVVTSADDERSFQVKLDHAECKQYSWPAESLEIAVKVGDQVRIKVPDASRHLKPDGTYNNIPDPRRFDGLVGTVTCLGYSFPCATVRIEGQPLNYFWPVESLERVVVIEKKPVEVTEKTVTQFKVGDKVRIKVPPRGSSGWSATGGWYRGIIKADERFHGKTGEVVGESCNGHYLVKTDARVAQFAWPSEDLELLIEDKPKPEPAKFKVGDFVCWTNMPEAHNWAQKVVAVNDNGQLTLRNAWNQDDYKHAVNIGFLGHVAAESFTVKIGQRVRVKPRRYNQDRLVYGIVDQIDGDRVHYICSDSPHLDGWVYVCDLEPVSSGEVMTPEELIMDEKKALAIDWANVTTLESAHAPAHGIKPGDWTRCKLTQARWLVIQIGAGEALARRARLKGSWIQSRRFPLVQLEPDTGEEPLKKPEARLAVDEGFLPDPRPLHEATVKAGYMKAMALAGASLGFVTMCAIAARWAGVF